MVGWGRTDPATGHMRALFELIRDRVPAPGPKTGDFAMLATTLESDNFLGRVLTGRIETGSIKVNDPIKALNRDGRLVERAGRRSC